MNALNPSHAALVAEVTALRATLNDAVELVEALRSERDAAVRSYSVLADERDRLRDAVEEALTWRGTDTTHAKLRAALGRSA